MPSFKGLVESTYERLSLEMSPPEKAAFGSERYEEVLASLKRRLIDPEDVTRSVSDLLAVPISPCLDHHCTILRLARDLSNRIVVVTTNFDTLLERAAATLGDKNLPKKISFAGQALPAPGSSDFVGIVHIHGRLADSELDLVQSPMVLTSTDFGEAYMRSGWASRFFFDLVRCKAIVLVGYSANDVPIRYLLNVLEADRVRFSDLRRVYAFAEYVANEKEAKAVWEALDVTALPYCKRNPKTREEDHAPLWRDLRKLVDIVEKPLESLGGRVRKILKQDFVESCEHHRREIAWILKRQIKLWPEALDTIVDTQWYDFFQQEGEWPDTNIAGLVASWIGKDLQSTDRFKCAMQWQRRMGQSFTEFMVPLLLDAKNLNQDWKVIWRLFRLAAHAQRNNTDFYRVQEPLNDEIVLDCDLRMAVDLLTSKLEMGRSPRPLEQIPHRDTLSSRLDTEMKVSSYGDAEELADTLGGMHDRALRILELATWELRSILELEKELGEIRDEYDHNDRAVPSIESHPQNEFQEGKVLLVQLMSECLPHAHTLDREGTKSIVQCWKHFPGRIGLRLHLHAMRDSGLFSAEDAISTLLSVSEQDFWLMRRESALLIRSRARDVAPELVSELERLILDSSYSHYGPYMVQPSATDLLIKNTRDYAVWLRLKMLKDADTLSDTGAKELASIIENQSDLDRAVEDRDFFWNYTCYEGPTIGGMSAIGKGESKDRLRVVREKIASCDPEDQEGWAAYCHSDPIGAVDTLLKRPFNPEDSEPWISLLFVLACNDSLRPQQAGNLSARALEHLLAAETVDLRSVIPALLTLIRQTRDIQTSKLDEWMVGLWGAVVQHPEQEIDFQDDIYKQVICSSAGQLTEALIAQIDVLLKAGSGPRPQQLQLLNRITECPGAAGFMGRAVLVGNIAFLIHWTSSSVVEKLKSALHDDDENGKALRVVMLQHHPASAEVLYHIKDVILKGLLEGGWSTRWVHNVASWVVLPALASIKQDTTVQWGITAADVSNIFKKPTLALLEGTLRVLNDQLKNENGNTEAAWSNTVSPFFRKIWPREAKFRNKRLTRGLVKLAVRADNKFPEAWSLLRPYISPETLPFPVFWYIIYRSSVTETFPDETLDLLWTVCDRDTVNNFAFLTDMIGRLVGGNPNLETDRRLLWLKRSSHIHP